MSNGISVMVVGSGAREHVISHAYGRSSQVARIIVAPGNDYIAHKRAKEVLIRSDCKLKEPDTILRVANDEHPDLIEVAQDDALAAGTVNLLNDNGYTVFGPTRGAARIEWDKVYSRELMRRKSIPHPQFHSFTSVHEAVEFVRDIYRANRDKEIYIKAAGLCGGKGALKARKEAEAMECLERMKTFGTAGESFVIEDALSGEEFSYYVISDGKGYHSFKSAQDNKRVGNFDLGDQTGGMGAVSPALVTKGRETEIERELIGKAIGGLWEDEHPYKGILYLGGIIVDGKLYNIEYNARWGDPEVQVVLPGLKTDYVDLVTAAIFGNIANIDIEEDDMTRVCVVGASRGYPNDYSAVKGKRIFGLEEAGSCPGVRIFGAGIKADDGRFYANGGRLFSVVGEGSDINEARERAYGAMARISIEGNNLHYRTDIGYRDVARVRLE